MEAIVYNSSFERLGALNGASSIIWHKLYHDVGDFEIYIDASEENVSWLQEGNYIGRDDDDEMGIIEDINIQYDVYNETDMMTVKGHFSESLYNRRVVWQQTTLETTIENGLRNLIMDNIIKPKSLMLEVTSSPSSVVTDISGSTGITGASVNKATFENFSSVNFDVVGSMGILSISSFNKTTFETKITKSDVYTFIYNGTNWTLDDNIVVLSEYGIVLVGTPIINDTLVVTYSHHRETGNFNFSYKANSSSATAYKSDSSELTRVDVDKEQLETKVIYSGRYKFYYVSNTSLAKSSIGESEGITASSVNKTTFESKISLTGVYLFKYDGTNWKLNNNIVTLNQYGITYTGTPKNSDEIIVYYAKHSWKLDNTTINIAEYGITYAGTPTSSDVILIDYVIAETGWFLNGNSVTLSDYGITYTGTVATGDNISIEYEKNTGITTATINKLKFQSRTPSYRTYVFRFNGKIWTLDGRDIDIESYGISYEEKPTIGNVITVTLSEMPNRIIENIVLGQSKGYTETLSAQYTGDDLSKIFNEVCQQSGIGYRNVYNNGIFAFELYKGVDRSYNQTENTYVIFSDEFDNISSSGYEKLTSDNKNTALVAGEGESLSRKTKEINPLNTGISRKELYVDARSISSNKGEISSSDYQALLEEKGLESLSEHLITDTFTGDVEITDRYTYKVDVNLGDICVIENKKWGLYLNSRIIGVIECDDENGYSILFEFGT